ncbi:hypothetical protein FRUB_01360 [Fimbriiglobus ruber]|uniref:Uncharacterized protein n=1 Tax=Fimbriiglobus ruber TaxID=1908690 RepID=A0A225E6A7_9BACT|nr:hypothetical protein FRUB_01360 [Fimbriiglobus ruber]
MERRRAFLITEAARSAVAGRTSDATRALDEAAGLRAGDEIRLLRAAVSLIQNDFHSAWTRYANSPPPRA